MAPIQLSTYDLRWPQEFEQARSDLLWAAEGYITRVEHIGGTAVPGMVAVAEIDLLAELRKPDDSVAVVPYLLGLGFEEQDWEELLGEPVLRLRKPRRGVAGQSVYIAARDGQFWHSALQLRERLRTHPPDVQRFSLLKQHLLAVHEGRSEPYEQQKAYFFQHLLDQLAAEARDARR